MNAENLRGYWFMIVKRGVGFEYQSQIQQQINLCRTYLKEFAFIYHDKGDIKQNHYHIIIHTTKQKTLLTISFLFECDVSDIELIKIPNKAIRYLIHKDNPDKYQYDVSYIITNISNIQLICSTFNTLKNNDNVMLYCLNLVNVNNVKSWAEFVDVCATTCPDLLGDIMRKYCYSISKYIECKNR